MGERVIPLYYFDADNFGDISDEDFRTVIDICKKYKVRYYRDSKNKGKDSGFRIFWGETSINNEKFAIIFDLGKSGHSGNKIYKKYNFSVTLEDLKSIDS